VLLQYPNLKTVHELNIADEMAQILVRTLGDAQYTDAGLNVWLTVRTFPNAMTKCEALIALGKMNATDVLPHVVQILKDTTTKGPVNRISGERIAYGAIVSLANYKDVSGYLPVFFAANGWYREWVRKEANNTLSQIQEDGTDQLVSALQDPAYDYGQKLLALQTIEKSSAADDAKAEAAVAGLKQGWLGFSNLPDAQYKLTRLRKLALSMIGRYGTEDAAVIGLANRSYRYGTDEEEQFNTIIALSKIASDDAVQLLGTYVTEINERQARGVFKQMDERRIRALINGLGNTHNQNAKPYLQLILSLNWTPAIVRLAKQAVDSL
jgi:hypothetical protein